MMASIYSLFNDQAGLRRAPERCEGAFSLFVGPLLRRHLKALLCVNPDGVSGDSIL